MLFDSNLSRRPFLGQVVNFDLLLCTGFDSEHEALFLCHIFTQRPMADRKIERSEGRGIVRNKFSPIPSRISARNLQSIKTFLTLELSQYRKSGTPVARFVKRAVRGPRRLPPTRKRPVFVLVRPTRPNSAGERHCRERLSEQASPCSELIHDLTRRRCCQSRITSPGL